MNALDKETRRATQEAWRRLGGRADGHLILADLLRQAQAFSLDLHDAAGGPLTEMMLAARGGQRNLAIAAFMKAGAPKEALAICLNQQPYEEKDV